MQTFLATLHAAILLAVAALGLVAAGGLLLELYAACSGLRPVCISPRGWALWSPPSPMPWRLS